MLGFLLTFRTLMGFGLGYSNKVKKQVKKLGKKVKAAIVSASENIGLEKETIPNYIFVLNPGSWIFKRVTCQTS